MELDFKKNLTAIVHVDNVKLVEHDGSRVYAKITKNDDEIFLFIKNSKTNRTIKLHLKQYVEEVEDKDI